MSIKLLELETYDLGKNRITETGKLKWLVFNTLTQDLIAVNRLTWNTEE